MKTILTFAQNIIRLLRYYIALASTSFIIHTVVLAPLFDDNREFTFLLICNSFPGIFCSVQAIRRCVLPPFARSLLFSLKPKLTHPVNFHCRRNSQRLLQHSVGEDNNKSKMVDQIGEHFNRFSLNLFHSVDPLQGIKIWVPPWSISSIVSFFYLEKLLN